MGIYSGHRNYNTIDLSTVVADESYNGFEGIGRIFMENIQNEQALFEAVISNDFEEAYIANESGDMEAIYALQEASFSGLIEKIKAFIRKILEKVKGIIKSFLARINGVVIRDNKQLVNKYKAEILKKDCSKMKYKWAKLNNDHKVSIVAEDELRSEIIRELDSIYNAIDDESKLNKLREYFTDGTFTEEVLGKIVGQSSCTLADFDKEFHDEMWGEVENEENFDKIKSEVMTDLVNSKSQIKEINDYTKAVEKICSEAIKKVDKENAAIVKLIPKNGSDEYNRSFNHRNLFESVDFLNEKKNPPHPRGYYKKQKQDMKAGGIVGEPVNPSRDDNESSRGPVEFTVGSTITNNQVNKVLNVASTMLSQTQVIVNKLTAALMRETQFEIKQNRRVWIQAAAYNPKKTESMDVLFGAIEEAVDYEVSSDFEMITV